MEPPPPPRPSSPNTPVRAVPLPRGRLLSRRDSAGGGYSCRLSGRQDISCFYFTVQLQTNTPTLPIQDLPLLPLGGTRISALLDFSCGDLALWPCPVCQRARVHLQYADITPMTRLWVRTESAPCGVWLLAWPFPGSGPLGPGLTSLLPVARTQPI